MNRFLSPRSLSVTKGRLRLGLVPTLRRYFHSGWAFLIPYLAAYLLYYWLKWPVNPVASAQLEAYSLEPPALLHVYWALHAVNIVLAVIALRAWWREQGKGDRSQISDGFTPRRDGAKVQAQSAPDFRPKALSATQPAAPTARGEIACKQVHLQEAAEEAEGTESSEMEGRSPSPSLSVSLKIAPWALLGLLFWIPGVYLEFPADPWEHYARINEWSWLHTVGEHTAWVKSGYFLAYSLLGKIAPPTRQLFWLDFYYTGACLLLCWQYFRLARSVGLGKRASMLFVILQAVLLGNNVFGFYRYYGISSSIFAQLGAIALIRMTIDFAKGQQKAPDDLATKGTESTEIATGELGHEGAQKFTKRTLPILARLCAFLWLKKSAQPAAREGIACEQAHPAPGFKLSALSAAAICAACLLTLVAFNHVQGLGIAGLGLLAVIVWRLIEWKRSMVFWLAVVTVALSAAAILWWPRNPALDAAYRPAGWLTAWYGFNVFSPSSLAFDRTIAILGLFGIVNLLAGFFLLRYNHLVAWLTITPLFALCLPFVVIPFANAVARRDIVDILTFQRLLLAIPAGLAIACLGAQFASRKSQDTPAAHGPIACTQAPTGDREVCVQRTGDTSQDDETDLWFSAARLFIPFSLLLLTLAGLLLVPADRPSYNRFWNALMAVPDDLRMARVVAGLDTPMIQNARTTAGIPLLTTYGQGAVASATGIRNVRYSYRATWTDANAMTWPYGLPRLFIETGRQKTPSLLLVPPTAALYSPLSLSGYLSTHWLPQAAILECTGASEFETAARNVGGKEIETAGATVYSLGEWKAATPPSR